ncbi:MAG: glucose 1-dehydrogenase [Streptosporangiales bacterium]|nr:glucose 1-dehydrogenase [Streptosporangiales bacterium]
MADRRFQGRVAIVTGGAGAFGSAVAARLLADGARVALVDNDKSQLERAAAGLDSGLDSEPGSVLAVPGDVAVEEDVAGYVRRTVDEYGRVDLFFNNAGIEGRVAAITELDVADFDRVQAVNVRGVFLGLQAVLRAMKRQGTGGAVVNTASIAGLRGAGNFSPYITSKHAVIGLTRCAAQEAGEYGVRVNAVAPGYMDTRMLSAINQQIAPDDPEGAAARLTASVKLGRLGSAEDVAGLVTWLLSAEAGYITGGVYVIDGGVTS